MKKTMLIIPLTAALILSSCGAQNQNSNETMTDTTIASDVIDSFTEGDVIAPMAPTVNGDAPVGGGKQPMKLISLDEAKAIALEYAGVTDSEAKFREYEQELDDGRYEFEFTVNGVEYEVYVAGGTGEVTHFKTDKDVGIPNFPDYNVIAPTPPTPANAPTTDVNMGNIVQEAEPPHFPNSPASIDDAEKITAEEAKSIALAKAGVTEADIRDYDIELEYGVYEIDFESGRTEYEIEIDAVTGEILKYETELD